MEKMAFGKFTDDGCRPILVLEVLIGDVKKDWTHKDKDLRLILEESLKTRISIDIWCSCVVYHIKASRGHAVRESKSCLNGTVGLIISMRRRSPTTKRYKTRLWLRREQYSVVGACLQCVRTVTFARNDLLR